MLVPLLRALFLWGGLASVAMIAHAAPAEVTLPEIGGSSRQALSSGEEAALGEAFLREIRRVLPLVDDVEIVTYVRTLGDTLAAASDEAEQRFRFFVVDAPTVNAFAGPGGIIAVNTGLLALSRTESELASVLAHEIAHVTQHHLARAVEVSDRTNPWAVAGILAGLILATQNAQAGQAAMATVMAGSIQKRLNFTRQNEHEADRVGTGLLARAGFDPRAMPSFFERLQQSNRFYAEPPEFLSSHPVTVTRIAESRARAEQYPFKQHVDSLDFLLVKAKISASSNLDPVQGAKDFRLLLENRQFRSEAATRYGLAVTLMRLKRWEAARPHIAWLVAREPARVSFLAAQADIEYEMGNVSRAEAIYRETIGVFTNDTLITQKYARLLLLEKRPGEAVALLENYVRARRPSTAIYALLARAYDGAGRALEANVALAEEQYTQGDIDAAIHQLGIALNQPGGNDYTFARTQARLEELQAEQRLRAQYQRS